jgi:hypothetical protein
LLRGLLLFVDDIVDCSKVEGRRGLWILVRLIVLVDDHERVSGRDLSLVFKGAHLLDHELLVIFSFSRKGFPR